MSKLVNKLVSRLSSSPGLAPRQNPRRRGGRRQRGQRGRRRRVVIRRIRPGRPVTVSNPSWGRSLPAAYAAHVYPRFNVSSRTANSVRVSGVDLVYPMPRSVESSDTYLFTVIPSNPAYWLGTRVARFAPAYMNFRPLSLTFSYIPQVSVAQSGTVFMGTVWNGSAPAENIQQTLVTSNGGCLTTCYVPCDTRIQLGANLQQNLFTMVGSINPNTSPFLFLAGVRGANVIPGYFMVHYAFEFKNPVGQAASFGRSSILTGSAIPTVSDHPNSSLVLLSSSGDFGPGTVFDLETDGVYFHGSPVSLSPSSSVVQFYNTSVYDGGSGPTPPDPTPTDFKISYFSQPGGTVLPLSRLRYDTSAKSTYTGFVVEIGDLNVNFFVVVNEPINISARPRYLWDYTVANEFVVLYDSNQATVATTKAVDFRKEFVDLSLLPSTRSMAVPLRSYSPPPPAACSSSHY